MTDQVITDGQARKIASDWHGGQWSALYQFASCGAISDALLTEVTRARESRIGARLRRELLALEKYIRNQYPDEYWSGDGGDQLFEREPVPGWSGLWDETPPTAAQAELWEVVTLQKKSRWQSYPVEVFGPVLERLAERHLASVQKSLPADHLVYLRTLAK